MALKSKYNKSYAFRDNTREVITNEYRNNIVYPSDELRSSLRFSSMRETLSWGLQSKNFFLLGTILVHGICTTDVQGKSSRYRNLSSRNETKTTQFRIAKWDSKEYFSKRKQCSGLENICGLCSDIYSKSKEAVCKRMGPI